MTASDKLFYWIFQNNPGWISHLLPDLAVDPNTYRFSAPVLKEQEKRLDGLFSPIEESPEQPVVILEAQMFSDARFLRRFNLECATLIAQDTSIDYWRAVLICPHRRLNFGRSEAVAEFLRERLHWIELECIASDASVHPVLQALALLVQPEPQLRARSIALQQQVADRPDAGAFTDVIAAIVLSRFNGRSIPDLCAMAGITLDDFSQSVAYREIFGQGEQRGREVGRQEGRQQGRQQGRQEGELDLALRQLRRRCGSLSIEQEQRIRALSLEQLEALAEALLDFQGPSDLNTWLEVAAS